MTDHTARAPDRLDPASPSPANPVLAAGPDHAIEIHGLRKTYGRGERATVALHGVDLAIPRGSIFGLLGPNGAGKSTLINILAGLVRKSDGQATIWGHDIDRSRRAASSSIGIVPQELAIDPFFTPYETLELQAGYYGVPRSRRRTRRILEALGLTDKADAYTRRLSGGMRRRLMVAKAMVHQPPVLVLDEPTAGVDVELRAQLWRYVRELNQAGTTILLTTHYLEEAEQMCDRIAIINRGLVVACDETARLVQQLDRKTLTLIMAEDLAAVPDSLSDLEPRQVGPRRIEIRYRPSEAAVSAILDAVSNAGLTVVDLTTEEPDLEDLFVQLTTDKD